MPCVHEEPPFAYLHTETSRVQIGAVEIVNGMLGLLWCTIANEPELSRGTVPEKREAFSVWCLYPALCRRQEVIQPY